MKKLQTILVIGMILLFASTTAVAKWDPELTTKCNATIAEFKKSDSGLSTFFSQAYGYAVFPKIGKAGLGIGGAHGTGAVYKHGAITGETKMTQLSFGWQAGGQAYQQIIFFENQKAYDDFTAENFEFSAQASAVALKSGIAASTSYNNGVAVFTQVTGGLMYEATLAGQKYSYKAK